MGLLHTATHAEMEVAEYEVKPYITRGYRKQNTHQVAYCVASVFRLHNETMNIWTHVIGALVFARLLLSHWLEDGRGGAWLLVLFCGVAVTCFLLSSCYHTFRCHSPGVFCTTLKMDAFGIQLLVSAHTFVFGHLMSTCNSTETIVLHSINIATVAAAVPALWMLFESDQLINQVCRISIFTLSAAMPLLATGYYFVFRGETETLQFTRLSDYTHPYCCYFLGLLLYITYAPESIFPRVFDIFGASHQLFHTLCVLGALFSYRSFHRVVSDLEGFTCAAAVH